MNLKANAPSAGNGYGVMRMTNLRKWWHGKTQAKKQNWMILATVICFIAASTVEALTYWSLIGAFPAATLVCLEIAE